jgi:hypothetical protein
MLAKRAYKSKKHGAWWVTMKAKKVEQEVITTTKEKVKLLMVMQAKANV